jgi:hypothetical protein
MTTNTKKLIEQLRDRAYSFKAPDPLVEAAANEIELLCEAIRRLAEQDATLSVAGGNVTVTMDATLTNEERAAIEWFAKFGHSDDGGRVATLRALLERLA